MKVKADCYQDVDRFPMIFWEQICLVKWRLRQNLRLIGLFHTDRGGGERGQGVFAIEPGDELA